MSISDKIDQTLRIYGMVLPTPVREVLREIGKELADLRAAVDAMKQQG